MIEILINYLIITLGVTSGLLLNSFLFILVKANKYEDTLAKKIASEVNSASLKDTLKSLLLVL